MKLERFDAEEGTEKYRFFCPGCRCNHYVNVAAKNGPVWGWNRSIDKPTFTPSILVEFGNQPGDERCHSFVTDGKIQFLNDCTHHLAGQTVDMEEV